MRNFQFFPTKYGIPYSIGTISNFQFDNRGVAALLTVLIVSVAALVIAFSATILGMGEMDMGYTAQKGQEAYSLANGCTEEALRHLQLDGNWTGGTLNFVEGTCIMGVVANGDKRTVTVLSNINNYYKKLKVLATVGTSTVAVTSWQEVEN